MNHSCEVPNADTTEATGTKQESSSTTSQSTKVIMEAHQLAKECYPPTDSDDDSFEVLETDSNLGDKQKDDEDFAHDVKANLLPSEGIDAALDLATESMLSAMTLQSLPQMPQMPSMSGSFVSSTSSEACRLHVELQEKVRELKKENETLRDIMAQQTLVTKNHSEVLSAWKEDVTRVHEAHKEGFQKMKAYTQHLKKENKQLKEMVQSTNSSLASVDTSSLEQKHEEALKDLNDKQVKELKDKFDELQQVKDELQLSTAKFNDATLELQQVKDELQQSTVKYNDASLELQRLKDELDKLQQQSMVIVQRSADKKLEEQQQFDKLLAEKEEQNNKVVNLLQEEKNVLERQMQQLRAAHGDEVKNAEEKYQMEISALKQQLSGNEKQAEEQLQQLLQKTKDELNAVNEQKEQQALRINDLKQKLAELSEVHEMLKGEFIKSKSEFSACRHDLQERCDEVILLKEQLEACRRDIIALNASCEGKIYLEEQLADYKRQVKANDDEFKRVETENQEAVKKEQELQKENMLLKCQLLKMRNEETAELQKLRIQLSEAQNSIVELKEAKKMVEKEATDNRSAVDEINKKLQSAKCDQDQIVALTEQLKIYQADYKTEHDGKVFVVEELNKVNQDLEKVQLRNRELIEEIERLRAAQDFVNVGSQASASKNSPSPPPLRFPCPMCQEVFRSLRLVEEHVEDCINSYTPH